MTNEAICQKIDKQVCQVAWTHFLRLQMDGGVQVRVLFPSAKEMTLLWHSVVKIGQSLYEEAPGLDPLRPSQSTPVPNFFLSGSYTAQDYIDSMEGATLSGLCCFVPFPYMSEAISRSSMCQ